MASVSAGEITVSVKDTEEYLRLVEDNEVLRKALIGLVGSDNVAELEQMEMVIRMAQIPDSDKANTINAIHAIVKTSGATCEH